MVSDSGKNFQEKREILQWSNSKARQRTVRVIWTTKRTLKQFQPESPSSSNMGNKDKDKEHSDSRTMGEGAESAFNAHQVAWDLSCERDAALSRQIAEAYTRETAKVTAHFQALLEESTTFSLQVALKWPLEQQTLSLWTPLTGLRTKLSTRDGNCGQERLDMPLKQWKSIQKRLKSHISTTG